MATTAVPVHKTPLPGAVMPLEDEKKFVPPQSDKAAHKKPSMVDEGDHDQTVPI